VSTQGTGNNSATTSKGSRLKGLLLLILGLNIGYVSIVIPLQEAYSKAPKISLYFKFAFLSPALICIGILVILVPSTLTDQSFMSRGHNKLSVAGWALVFVFLIIGFGTYYLLDQQINSLGYK